MTDNLNQFVHNMETTPTPQQSYKRATHSNVRVIREEWTLIPAAEIEDFNKIHNLDWQHLGSHGTAVPQTVFGALVEDGTIKDPFFGKNLESCDTDPYTVPWIYRKVFDLDPSLPADFVELTFEGINYRANVWLNGSKIADAAQLESPFRIYSLDVTKLAKPSGNVLVVEAIPPAKDDLTIGWVDWNPYPPDNNLGLWRPVKLRQTGPVSLEGQIGRAHV